MIISAALGTLGAAATLPGTLELLGLTGAALVSGKKARRGAEDPHACGTIAVVVPAHDEATNVARCVASLREATPPPNGVRLVVVADNCSDDTAERARDAGAEVLVRTDARRRGKGYALEFAFRELLEDEAIEAVLVVDADTTVSREFFVEAAGAFGAGADGVQCRYLVSNPEVSRVRNVALLAFNVVRPRARELAGLSVGILGNGFGLHRRVLERLPYTARSVVEDLEYHLMMVREGFRMRFLDSASVSAPLPTTVQGETTQRSRWEGGRYRMILDHAPSLLREVSRGRGRLLEPLGELLLLPLATHVSVLMVVLVVPFPPTQLYALGAMAVVAAHVGVTLYVTDASAEDLRALASTPLYVARKLRLAPKIFRAASRSQSWVRTERASGPDA